MSKSIASGDTYSSARGSRSTNITVLTRSTLRTGTPPKVVTTCYFLNKPCCFYRWVYCTHNRADSTSRSSLTRLSRLTLVVKYKCWCYTLLDLWERVCACLTQSTYGRSFESGESHDSRSSSGASRTSWSGAAILSRSTLHIVEAHAILSTYTFLTQIFPSLNLQKVQLCHLDRGCQGCQSHPVDRRWCE